jgi:polysaccharide pyruvyl transferase CsaB
MLLQSIISNLREYRPGVSITVLSKRPKETRAQYGVQAVSRFNFLAVYLRLTRARLLITGGGNLMQDETSTQSLLYYLWVLNTARRLHVKNMLYANGIGPVSKPTNIERVRKALNRVDLITLRDKDSLSVLHSMGITAPQTVVTADAAFALPPADSTLAKPALRRLGVDGPYFCVSLRDWAAYPPHMESEIARFADYMVEKYRYQAVFVPMRAADDMEISRRVIDLMKNPGYLLPPSSHSPEEGDPIRAVVGDSQFVLGMRLHALIYALEKGVPVIGLVYTAKVRQHMEYMGQPWHMELCDVATDRLIAYADEIMGKKHEISEQILQAGQIVKEKAGLNAKLCVGLLGSV